MTTFVALLHLGILVFLLLFLVVRNLLVSLLLAQQLNGIANKLRMLLNNLLDLLLVVKLHLILFHVQHNLTTAAQWLAMVDLDRE